MRIQTLRHIGGLYLAALGNVEALTVALLILPWVISRNRDTRILTILLALFTIALLVETYLYGHYAAPAAAIAAAIGINCLRHLRHLGPPVGPLLVRAAVCVSLLVLLLVVAFYHWPQDAGSWHARRNAIHEMLTRSRRYLVLVRYGNHDVHQEWRGLPAVDLGNNAPVLWARWMDEATNRRLLEHYKDHKALLFEPDSPRLELHSLSINQGQVTRDPRQMTSDK